MPRRLGGADGARSGQTGGINNQLHNNHAFDTHPSGPGGIFRGNPAHNGRALIHAILVMGGKTAQLTLRRAGGVPRRRRLLSRGVCRPLRRCCGFRRGPRPFRRLSPWADYFWLRRRGGDFRFRREGRRRRRRPKDCFGRFRHGCPLNARTGKFHQRNLKYLSVVLRAAVREKQKRTHNAAVQTYRAKKPKAERPLCCRSGLLRDVAEYGIHAGRFPALSGYQSESASFFFGEKIMDRASMIVATRTMAAPVGKAK